MSNMGDSSQVYTQTLATQRFLKKYSFWIICALSILVFIFSVSSSLTSFYQEGASKYSIFPNQGLQQCLKPFNQNLTQDTKDKIDLMNDKNCMTVKSVQILSLLFSGFLIAFLLIYGFGLAAAKSGDSTANNFISFLNKGDSGLGFKLMFIISIILVFVFQFLTTLLSINFQFNRVESSLSSVLGNEDIIWDAGYHLSLTATVFAGINIIIFIFAYAFYLWSPASWSQASNTFGSKKRTLKNKLEKNKIFDYFK